MADEFKRIMEFFDLPPEEREKHVQEIFEESVAFFEHFKHIAENGTPEEKKEATEKVLAMKKRIEQETGKILEKTGMSEKELAEYSKNPENFTPDQWESMEKSKEQLEKGVKDLKRTFDHPEETGKADGEADAKKGKKRRKKPKNWIQS